MRGQGAECPVEIAECRTEADFAKALEFVLPRERFCCLLAQKIGGRAEGVFALQRSGLVCGVFYYREGHTLFSCLPKRTKKIAAAISSFFSGFSGRNLFALAGKRDYVVFFAKALNLNRDGMRTFRLMHYSGRCVGLGAAKRGRGTLGYSEKDIVACSIKDATALMPLHEGFTKEEVLPPGKEAYAPSLMHDLESLLKKQTVLALVQDGKFVAKAQTSGGSAHFAQIGGVYTLPAYRRRGCAEFVTRAIVAQIEKSGKTPLLFVDKKNAAALALYKKCGFRAFGAFCVLYCQNAAK